MLRRDSIWKSALERPLFLVLSYRYASCTYGVWKNSLLVMPERRLEESDPE